MDVADPNVITRIDLWRARMQYCNEIFVFCYISMQSLMAGQSFAFIILTFERLLSICSYPPDGRLYRACLLLPDFSISQSIMPVCTNNSKTYTATYSGS